MWKTHRWFYLGALLALHLAVVPPFTAVQAQRNSGWWIVLGSVASPDNNFTPDVERTVRHIEAAARRCGLRPFQDFSSKFGFTPGYTVVVVGAYGSKTSADQVLPKAKECLPDAYIKQGSYAGE
jgi:hypothetical protein